MDEKGVILMTGYEAFGEFEVNPSIAACNRLEGKTFNGYRAVVEEIPMRFQEVRGVIEGHLVKYRPAAVVCTGVSGAGASIAVERVAINVFDVSGRNVMGKVSPDQPLREGGPAAYFTTLPFREILAALKEAKIPAALSNSAGTVGCNQIFYHLMDYLATEGVKIPAGFVHIPRLPEQALGRKAPSMSLDTSVKALEAIARASL